MPLQPKKPGMLGSNARSRRLHVLESPAGRELRRWLERDFARDGFDAHGVVIASEAPRTHMRGAVAAVHTIGAGAEALAVPRTVWLESTAGSTTELVGLLEHEVQKLHTSMSSSPWSPYLQFVLDAGDGTGMHSTFAWHPVCWTTSKLQSELSGTSIVNKIEEYRANVAEHELPSLAIVLSRSFRFASGTLALVPWADSLNHSSSAARSSEAELEHERQNVAALSAAYDVHPGDELCDSYGQNVSKADLFANFGFVEPNAPDSTQVQLNDGIEVAVNVPPPSMQPGSSVEMEVVPSIEYVALTTRMPQDAVKRQLLLGCEQRIDALDAQSGVNGGDTTLAAPHVRQSEHRAAMEVVRNLR